MHYPKEADPDFDRVISIGGFAGYGLIGVIKNTEMSMYRFGSGRDAPKFRIKLSLKFPEISSDSLYIREGNPLVNQTVRISTSRRIVFFLPALFAYLRKSRLIHQKRRMIMPNAPAPRIVPERPPPPKRWGSKMEPACIKVRIIMM
jgi:hypothetical protein